MSRTRTCLVGVVTALAVAGVGAAVPSGAVPATGARAGTSVTLGQTSGAPVTPCPASMVSVQHTTFGGSPYDTPTAGVITSFSYQANANAGQVRMLLFTKQATNSFTLVGKSAMVSAPANALSTYPTRVVVPAGALLGAQVSSLVMQCTVNTLSSGDEYKSGTFDPDTSSSFTTTGSVTGRLDISAVLESDADGDGYGDVTQDLCPTSPTTQTACGAPDTTVTKAPKKKSTKRKVTIKFSSSVAGSTFTCAVDKKPAKPCTSPFKKKFKVGKHRVVITAVSGGAADPTPVTVKFKVTKPATEPG